MKCELLQTLDWGMNWTRVAPDQQFIPLGAAGDFDSHTLYTAWSGEQLPTLNPSDAEETLFYYSGGTWIMLSPHRLTNSPASTSLIDQSRTFRC